ncbi:hypothetical protein EAG_09089 [Camponotus floridanus]|uniref:Uncharacterized protein n=1 Tax=Camponotus floridanus TaxID=104421 RepID=E2AHA0_CAMFO|nr:hypothetical protein EAG_09089 [Camponotus floridanus]
MTLPRHSYSPVVRQLFTDHEHEAKFFPRSFVRRTTTCGGQVMLDVIRTIGRHNPRHPSPTPLSNLWPSFVFRCVAMRVVDSRPLRTSRSFPVERKGNPQDGRLKLDAARPVAKKNLTGLSAAAGHRVQWYCHRDWRTYYIEETAAAVIVIGSLGGPHDQSVVVYLSQRWKGCKTRQGINWFLVGCCLDNRLIISPEIIAIGRCRSFGSRFFYVSTDIATSNHWQRSTVAPDRDPFGTTGQAREGSDSPSFVGHEKFLRDVRPNFCANVRHPSEWREFPLCIHVKDDSSNNPPQTVLPSRIMPRTEQQLLSYPLRTRTRCAGLWKEHPLPLIKPTRSFAPSMKNHDRAVRRWNVLWIINQLGDTPAAADGTVSD